MNFVSIHVIALYNCKSLLIVYISFTFVFMYQYDFYALKYSCVIRKPNFISMIVGIKRWWIYLVKIHLIVVLFLSEYVYTNEELCLSLAQHRLIHAYALQSRSKMCINYSNSREHVHLLQVIEIIFDTVPYGFLRYF